MKKERIHYDRSFRGVKQMRDFYAKAGVLERLERGEIDSVQRIWLRST